MADAFASALFILPSFRRQQLLIEFASLKHHAPEGIYLTINANNPASWSGIFFVRSGAYAPAVLRFEIAFPPDYPEAPPLITFSTEFFHPLLVPLTTFAFSAGSIDPSTTISSSETERLPPGAFNLQHRFIPHTSSPKNSLPGEKGPTEVLRDEIETVPSSDGSSGTVSPQQCLTNSDGRNSHSITAILDYVKAAFENPSVLDDLPIEAAGNQSAWHAWRSYRGLPKMPTSSDNPPQPGTSQLGQASRNPADWNWDGLWEARVRNGIEESLSDALLFGSQTIRSTAAPNDSIRFGRVDDDKLETVQMDMLRMLGLQPMSAGK